jgi:hypothetical protein
VKERKTEREREREREKRKRKRDRKRDRKKLRWKQRKASQQLQKGFLCAKKERQRKSNKIALQKHKPFISWLDLVWQD